MTNSDQILSRIKELKEVEAKGELGEYFIEDKFLFAGDTCLAVFDEEPDLPEQEVLIRAKNTFLPLLESLEKAVSFINGDGHICDMIDEAECNACDALKEIAETLGVKG